MGYQTKVYRDTGGDRIVVASGGTVEVESGGSLTIASGGTVAVESGGSLTVAGEQNITGSLKLAGTAVTKTAAQLNALNAYHVSKVVVAGTVNNVQTIVAMPKHSRVLGMVVTVASAWGDNASLKIGTKAVTDAFMKDDGAGVYVQTAGSIMADRVVAVPNNVALLDGVQSRTLVAGTATTAYFPVDYIFPAATNIIATPSAVASASRTATVHVFYNEL